MPSPDHVAVDASKPVNDDRLYNLGIAIEVSDNAEFEEYYFEKVGEFCDEYNIDLPFNVIKGELLGDRLPSYEYTEAISDLSEKLVKNPAISRIHMCLGWYSDDVSLPFQSGNTISGIQFASNHLSQYFPVVTLWRYHYSNDYSLPEVAYVDNVQGKITKSWKYVGKQFELNLIPNADITYPSVSTADILSYNISSLLPNDKPFSELKNIAGSWLINNKNTSTDPYVDDEAVNSNFSDHIVPEYGYNIKPEIHHPNPTVYVVDDIFGDVDGEIEKTGIHAMARKYAYENRGCVVNVHAPTLPASINDGDVILYTRGSDVDRAELYGGLDPSMSIKVIESSDIEDELL
jgi:hypothetical protein